MSTAGRARDRILRGFDLALTPRTAEEVRAEVEQAVATGTTLRIANLNLHGLYMYETDPEFARYTDNAELRLIDGWPLLHLVEGPAVPSRYRIGSSDWLEALLPNTTIRIAAIGATPESAAKAESNVRRKYGADWRGIAGFDLEQHQATIEALVRNADLVLVGLGMPRQEHWILRNEPILRGKVVANVGGCIDLFAGEQVQVPRWLGRIGLEWLVRLIRSPIRLFRRYLIEPLLLAFLVFRRIRREGRGQT